MNATATTTTTTIAPSAATHPSMKATTPSVSSVAPGVEAAPGVGPVAPGRATSRRLPLLRAGIAAGAVAAVANTLVVLAARAVDIPITVSGESIPLVGFAQLTLIGALLGVALARVSARAAHPRRAFTVVTVALTALSLIPDITADATTGTRLTLALTHLVAAAIIIPALAHRLHR